MSNPTQTVYRVRGKRTTKHADVLSVHDNRADADREVARMPSHFDAYVETFERSTFTCDDIEIEI